MAQQPMNSDAPADHQTKREWQRDERDASTERKRWKRVERYR